jgi:hypothetical protein
MTTKLDQIQQDIQRLPEAAQDLLIDFIQILKKRYVQPVEPAVPQSTYAKFVESGLIGCVEIEEDLSTTYKQVLAEGLADKYDH